MVKRPHTWSKASTIEGPVPVIRLCSLAVSWFFSRRAASIGWRAPRATMSDALRPAVRMWVWSCVARARMNAPSSSENSATEHVPGLRLRETDLSEIAR